MRYKLIIAGIIASGAYLLAVLSRRKSRDGDSGFAPETHEVVVKEIKGEWRVVLADNESESDIHAKRGDDIIWDIIGSDVTFEFPKKGILGFKNMDVKAGPFERKVARFSPRGKFEYSVFIKKSGTYARGQSPPRIFVK